MYKDKAIAVHYLAYKCIVHRTARWDNQLLPTCWCLNLKKTKLVWLRCISSKSKLDSLLTFLPWQVVHGLTGSLDNLFTGSLLHLTVCSLVHWLTSSLVRSLVHWICMFVKIFKSSLFHSPLHHWVRNGVRQEKRMQFAWLRCHVFHGKSGQPHFYF